MTVTRRQAVRLGAASAATAVVGVGSAGTARAAAAGPAPAARRAPGSAAAASRTSDAAAPYRLAFWRGLVGSRIGLADGSGSFLVVRVQDLTSSKASKAAAAGPSALAAAPRKPARTGEAFVVRLRGDAPGLSGDDRVVPLSHPAVGRFTLFVTSADPGSHEYAAVVNRRLPSA